MSDPPICIYCLEIISPNHPSPLPPSTPLTLSCACKGATSIIHIQCKAKFAHIQTYSSSSSPHTREYYWTHCEICHSPFHDLDVTILLAKERHLQSIRKSKEDISQEAFWKEVCMSACFLATCIVKKCKNAGKATTSSNESKQIKTNVPFWSDGCNTLSGAIQLLRQVTPSSRQLALLWSAEMKFVDCLYYVFQMMIDQSTSLEENESAYHEVVKLVKKYDLQFASLALSMMDMKKFADDVSKRTRNKRNAQGELMLSRCETEEFERLKLMIVKEMKLANEVGGVERHCFSRQLSCQVEFVNYDIYGK